MRVAAILDAREGEPSVVLRVAMKRRRHVVLVGIAEIAHHRTLGVERGVWSEQSDEYEHAYRRGSEPIVIPRSPPRGLLFVKSESTDERGHDTDRHGRTPTNFRKESVVALSPRASVSLSAFVRVDAVDSAEQKSRIRCGGWPLAGLGVHHGFFAPAVRSS